MSTAMEPKCVFVTGGAGFIGSHTIIELLNANYDVVVVDNFANCVPSTAGSSNNNNNGSESGRCHNDGDCESNNEDEVNKNNNQNNNSNNNNNNNNNGTIGNDTSPNKRSTKQQSRPSSGDPQVPHLQQQQRQKLQQPQLAESLVRAQEISGKKIHFYECDLLDKESLSNVFKKHKIDCVIHFAAMKAVGESMQKPLFYYKNNIVSTIHLLEVMKEQGVYRMVFSSSCVVYGHPQYLPIDEAHPAGNVANVYGRTKFAIEKMLEDIARAEKQWNIICLRYFNPLGAHPSGRIGEDPVRAFTNLMPIIGEVAMGRRKELDVYGADYDTEDGTGVRDFIHVMDLASGHVAALRALDKQLRFRCYNLGTGRGTSILELIRTFEEVTGQKIPYKILARRLGDIPAIWGDCSLAEAELQWKAKFTLKDMCEDFWRWMSKNPNGYPRATEIMPPTK